MHVMDIKDRPAAALVLAGGSGTRMSGGEMPKQYMMLAGKPVIVWALERFLACEEIGYVVVICPESRIAFTEELLAEHLQDAGRVTVAAGGSDRTASLFEGLKVLRDVLKADGNTVVLSHDAARPFVTERIIKENIECTEKYGACGTVFPATDTIFISRDAEMIDEIPERKTMFQAQTPQSFRLEEMYGLIRSFTEEERAAFTDACGILKSRGLPVGLVTGERTNIKLTYPQDLFTAGKIAEELSRE